MIKLNFSENNDFACTVMEVIGRPKVVAEVGTFDAGHLQSLPFVFDRQCRLYLFEPNPECVRDLRSVFAKADNVEITEVAIGDEYGQADLLIPRATPGNPNAASSAFLEGVSSPYIARESAGNNENMDSVRVEVVPFSEFDPGDIEALHVDTEGNEWKVIKTLISRPKLISLEMFGKFGYENANKTLIEEWMNDNGYQEYLVGKNDIIYVKKRSDNE